MSTQSVRLNIAGLNSAVPLDRVEAAARAACIHDDVHLLPMGYDTHMLDDGGTFSGGQRQRIALARALIVGPRILILDEATSALDALTEQSVFQSVRGLACTRVVIAHRLSTIANADRILVLDAGRLVAQGTHPVLLKESPLYRDLVGAQGPDGAAVQGG
jgi:ABC-type multidrug transport system fused ATPase/permease subunit